MSLSISSTVALNNGVPMPMLGLGTWNSQAGREAEQAVRYALAIGYRLIDTATAYGNEASIGAAIAESGIDRREIFVTTKVWIDDQGYEATRAACRRSLAALRFDYLDLYLIHWPAPNRWLDAWRAMTELQNEGLCRAIGVSNFTIHHLEELQAASPVVPAVNQVEFNPFAYKKDLLQYCRDHRIQLESYSPLTRGARLNHPTLMAIAKTHGKTPAQILIRWPLQHQVVVIPKSAHRERIKENADVFDFELSAEEMAALDALNEDYSALSRDWRAQFE